jgi:hypothetical protein
VGFKILIEVKNNRRKPTCESVRLRHIKDTAKGKDNTIESETLIRK